jgi:hypothetical protein
MNLLEIMGIIFAGVIIITVIVAYRACKNSKEEK